VEDEECPVVTCHHLIIPEPPEEHVRGVGLSSTGNSNCVMLVDFGCLDFDGHFWSVLDFQTDESTHNFFGRAVVSLTCECLVVVFLLGAKAEDGARVEALSVF